MAVDIVPDYGATQMHGRWAALYKILSSQGEWRYVKDKVTGKPLLFNSFREARDGAKEFVRIVLNRRLPHMEKEVAIEDEDILGIEDWRNGKREDLATTQILRNKKSMKPVIVERKGQKVKNHGKASK